jgi:hypothetical protein
MGLVQGEAPERQYGEKLQSHLIMLRAALAAEAMLAK